MLDPKVLKSYQDASIDIKWYQSEAYQKSHQLDMSMEALSNTIGNMPKLLESLMMLDVYINSSETSDEMKVKYRKMRDGLYAKFTDALIAIGGQE